MPAKPHGIILENDLQGCNPRKIKRQFSEVGFSEQFACILVIPQICAHMLLKCSYRHDFFKDFLGQVWYLIVSIPDLCTITYFQDLYSFQGLHAYENYRFSYTNSSNLLSKVLPRKYIIKNDYAFIWCSIFIFFWSNRHSM